jgi:hypothetical protein
MGTYVLVHGAWHTGKELEPVATVIRAEGHTIHALQSKGIDQVTRSLLD